METKKTFDDLIAEAEKLKGDCTKSQVFFENASWKLFTTTTAALVQRRQKIRNQNDENQRLRSKRDEIQIKVDNLERQIGKLKEELNMAKFQLAAVNKDAFELQDESVWKLAPIIANMEALKRKKLRALAAKKGD